MEYELNQIKDLKAAEANVASASSDFFALSSRNMLDGMQANGLNLPDKQAEMLVNNLTKLQNTGKIRAGSKEFTNFNNSIMKGGMSGLPEALQKLSDESGATAVLQKGEERIFNIAKNMDKYGNLKSDYEKRYKVSYEEKQQAKNTYMGVKPEYYVSEDKRNPLGEKKDTYFQKKNIDNIYNEQLKNLKFGGTSLSTTVSALTTSISSTLPAINKTMTTTIPTGLEKTTVEVTKGNTAAKDDSLEVKSLLQSILNADSNGYVQLLRQGEVTNALLDGIIEATINGKSVTMDGMRVTKALQKVKDKQYGLGGKVSTYTDLPNAGVRIAAG